MDESSEQSKGRTSTGILRGLPRFIGRRQQLEWLELCLKEVIAGRPHVVLIEGEAGIGKTRLVKELHSMAQARRLRPLYGRCYEHLVLPYMPLLEGLLPELERLPGGVQHPGRSDAELIGRVLHRYATSARQSLAPEGDQDRTRLFLAVSQSTIRLAQQAPTLLILEDLHWADGASLELIAHLTFAVADAAEREPVPLMIVCTYRPAEPGVHLARVLSQLQREDTCQTLQLPGFTEAEVTELLNALELERPSHQLVATLSEATQGNPLFVQEVIGHLTQQGALYERGGYLVTSAAPPDLRFPDRITGVIAARLQGLSAGCRKVLTLAALVGDGFSISVLGELSGLTEEEVSDLLEEAISQRLVVSEEQVFRFAHPLIRHVFHSEPDAVWCQRLHQQIAQMLERRYGADLHPHLLEIAYHLIAAGPAAEAAKVVHYARRAGDQALALFAWAEAAHFYEAAVAAGAGTDELSAGDRAELHYRAGLARYRDMDIGLCLEQYEKAIAAYRLTSDAYGLAHVLIDKVRAYFTMASVPYGSAIDVQPLAEILDRLGDGDLALRLQIWATIAEAYWHARQTEKARVLAQRALDAGQRTNSRSCVLRAFGCKRRCRTGRTPWRMPDAPTTSGCRGGRSTGFPSR